MPDPPGPPIDLAAVLADLEARVAALEAATPPPGKDDPAGPAGPADLDRLEWFVKHGRRRPW